jgi:hypothetical protein
MGAAIANESKINEHKNNRTGDAISNADYVRHANRYTSADVDAVADPGEQHADRSFGNPDVYMQMQQHRSETQQAQKEAYQRYLIYQIERHTQQSPTDYAMPADMQHDVNNF